MIDFIKIITRIFLPILLIGWLVTGFANASQIPGEPTACADLNSGDAGYKTCPSGKTISGIAPNCTCVCINQNTNCGSGKRFNSNTCQCESTCSGQICGGRCYTPTQMTCSSPQVWSSQTCSCQNPTCNPCPNGKVRKTGHGTYPNCDCENVPPQCPESCGACGCPSGSVTCNSQPTCTSNERYDSATCQCVNKCTGKSCACDETCNTTTGNCETDSSKTCASGKKFNSACQCVDMLCPSSCRCGCDTGSDQCRENTVTCATGRVYNSNQCACVCNISCGTNQYIDDATCTCKNNPTGCPNHCSNGCFSGTNVCKAITCSSPCHSFDFNDNQCKSDCNNNQRCDTKTNSCKLRPGGYKGNVRLEEPPTYTVNIPSSAPAANPGKVLMLSNRAVNIQGEQSIRSIYSIGRTDRPDYLCWQEKTKGSKQYKLRLDYFCPPLSKCPYGVKCQCRDANNNEVPLTICQYANLDPLRTESFGLHSKENPNSIPKKDMIINNNHTVPITTH